MEGLWPERFGEVFWVGMPLLGMPSQTKQSRGQNAWSAIQSNTPNDSTENDKYQEGIRQREVKKYLRESYYHRIECSTTNSLAVFM